MGAADQTRPSSLDETMETCIGDFSWPQFFQSLLVSMAWIFDAQQTFISVFTDAVPSWHCTAAESICSPALSSLCSIPRDSWAWDYLPAHTSIVSEWELQCASIFITGIPTSAFFAGCLTGGLLFAALADSSLGRKNMLLLSCFIMSATSLLTAFSTNLWIYSMLRFICGVGRATVGTCSLVLASELVGKRWRGQVAILGFFCFTLGFLSLPSLAYMNMGCTWRNMYLLTSIPTLFYCLLVKLTVHESPRWLFIKGRREDAISTLQSLTSRDYNNSVTIFETLVVKEAAEDGDGTYYSSMKMLFAEKRWAVRRVAAVMAVGFGIGITYYGMPLGLANLSFSLYLSVTLNALAELPASLLTFLFIHKLRRKTSLLFFTLMSGGFSMLSVGVAAGGLIQMGLEMISFFFVCSSFNMILIYTLELFPTCVRNSAISMVREALVLGGVFSPLLVAAGRGLDNGAVTAGVFGLLISLCGLFVAFLPETRGGRLCDTLEEEENKHLTTNHPC
uniref:Major facilitator superfamily (MFS) profile domain-containing protein n=1 Tax=Kalanchoe fedtschenkoi TaxID=63787 RepID=A0A7N0SVV5_KALFE